MFICSRVEENQYLTRSIIIACTLKPSYNNNSRNEIQGRIHKLYTKILKFMLFICFPSFRSFISTDEIVIVRRKKIITVIDDDAFCYINNFMCFRRSLDGKWKRIVSMLAPSVNYVNNPNLGSQIMELVSLITPIQFHAISWDMKRKTEIENSFFGGRSGVSKRWRWKANKRKQIAATNKINNIRDIAIMF